MYNQGFAPQGNTILVNASSTGGSVAVQASTGSIDGVLVSVQGTVGCYMSVGVSTATATIPTTTTAGGMFLSGGTLKGFRVPPNAWLSFMTSAGTVPVFVTPGKGI